MTDIEKLTKLFVELGIGFFEKDFVITCQKGDSKVGGFDELLIVFNFVDDGRLINMEVQEKHKNKISKGEQE